jgi:hypothetical protein
MSPRDIDISTKLVIENPLQVNAAASTSAESLDAHLGIKHLALASQAPAVEP